MPNFNYPGIYLEEVSIKPLSVAEVETAVPVFIGYTVSATKRHQADLLFRHIKISSLVEYAELFGESQPEPIHLNLTSGAQGLEIKNVTPRAPRQLMWYAMSLFFANGGQCCYIISVGDYQQPPTLKALMKGVQQAAKIDDATILVTPEATAFSHHEYEELVQAQLSQSAKLADRFSILDLYDGDKPLSATELQRNRRYLGSESLDYGACYYPFIQSLLPWQLASSCSNVTANIDGGADFKVTSLRSSKVNLFNDIHALLKHCYVTVPPSPIMAGIYTKVDHTRGVWKAPAGVAITGVSSPAVNIDDDTNDMLNTDALNGKSVNAIRTFKSKGTLAWGARTLAGNDNDWRYIPVRRFVMVVTESIKKSLAWTVFEPNGAQTWSQIKLTIDNYLELKWRAGAFQGSTAKEAWFVQCGLGTTMTADDINNGFIVIEIGLALLKPAEFLILRFKIRSQSS